jgi:hypothetical protein
VHFDTTTGIIFVRKQQSLGVVAPSDRYYHGMFDEDQDAVPPAGRHGFPGILLNLQAAAVID